MTEKYIFKPVKPDFNPNNWRLGKANKEFGRLHNVMRRCNILNPKYGDFPYYIVLLEHKKAILGYGVINIDRLGYVILTEKPFWIQRSEIEIERVID